MILFIVSTAVAQDAQEPTYAADVPEFLLTPDKVETDQKSAGLDSNNPSVKPNQDGSYYDFMAHWNLGSTRHGSRAILN
jgi:hypothetical protein